MAENQATPKTVPLGIDFLNFCAARFGEHADNFTAVAADMLGAIANDLKLAAKICDRLASLRFEIAEIASKADLLDPDTARELRDALDDAAKGV
jgi:hypothetical protein